MKVYIAFEGWDYEGRVILGVFDSREKAETKIKLHIQVYKGDWREYDGLMYLYSTLGKDKKIYRTSQYLQIVEKEVE